MIQPFLAFPRRRSGGVETLISGGTNIGDMTSGGGLAGAFDGNTNQATSAGARRVATPTNGYVGKTLAVPCPITKVEVWGSNNFGYGNSGSPTITVRLYGKNGSAPSGGTDGTQLATTNFTDTMSAVKYTLTSTDQVTVYTHVWVYIIVGDNGGAVNCAEANFYGLL